MEGKPPKNKSKRKQSIQSIQSIQRTERTQSQDREYTGVIEPKSHVNNEMTEGKIETQRKAPKRSLSQNWLALQEKIGGRKRKRKPVEKQESTISLVEQGKEIGATKYVSMDCEMVGVGDLGQRSALARVSIVNYFGYVLLDEYVKVAENVTDYRTQVSGIRPENLRNGITLKEAQSRVAELLHGRILVGHTLKYDLNALMIKHPSSMIRDLSTYKPLMTTTFNGQLKRQSLKNMVHEHLSIPIQLGEHSSVEDAQATMLLFKKFQVDWEKSLKLNVIMERKERKDSQSQQKTPMRSKISTQFKKPNSEVQIEGFELGGTDF